MNNSELRKAVSELMDMTNNEEQLHALKVVKNMLNQEPNYKRFKYVHELPFRVGDRVVFRHKTSQTEFAVLVTGIEYSNDDIQTIEEIYLGYNFYTPQHLFENYELLNIDCEYLPFGVIVD